MENPPFSRGRSTINGPFSIAMLVLGGVADMEDALLIDDGLFHHILMIFHDFHGSPIILMKIFHVSFPVSRSLSYHEYYPIVIPGSLLDHIYASIVDGCTSPNQ